LILVDSSVWIDYFNGTITPQTEKLDSLLGHEPLAIGDLILTEVLQGFTDEREFNQARRMLTSLAVIELGTENRDSSGKEFPGATPPRRHRSQDHRYGDCNPMYRGRIYLAA
jgi:hypothetical protein